VLVLEQQQQRLVLVQMLGRQQQGQQLGLESQQGQQLEQRLERQQARLLLRKPLEMQQGQQPGLQTEMKPGMALLTSPAH